MSNEIGVLPKATITVYENLKNPKLGQRLWKRHEQRMEAVLSVRLKERVRWEIVLLTSTDNEQGDSLSGISLQRLIDSAGKVYAYRRIRWVRKSGGESKTVTYYAADISIFRPLTGAEKLKGVFNVIF